MKMKNSSKFLSIIPFCLSCLLFFSAPARGQDSDEPDNSSDEAKNIILHGTVQAHTLHDAQDTDWVKFYALSEESYRVEAKNPGKNCDLRLQLYDTDGATLTASGDHTFEGEDEFLEWTCPEDKDGVYYVKVSLISNTSCGSSDYGLQAFRPIASDGGWIQGSVRDVSGMSVKEARLKTTGNGSDMSKNNGEYSIFEIPGEYVLTAEAKGYQKVVETLLKLEGGGSISKDIEMYFPGDINRDKYVNLLDAVLALRIATGENISQTIYNEADVNGDAQIGLAEAVYALRKDAETE